MDLFTVSVSLLACLAAFLLGTVWVGISLFMVGLVAFYFFTGSPTLAILSNRSPVLTPTMPWIKLLLLTM